MKTLISSRRASACALATVIGALVLQSPALAGNHSGRRDGHAAPRWDSKTVQTQRTATGHERHTTWTGQNGRTATRDAVVTNDREAGTRSRDVTSTGPNGKTQTVNDVTTRTDSGYNRETVVNHADGSTLTRDVTSSYDPETKTRTKEITVDRDPPPVPALSP
jgi:hypothetical protein